MRGRGVELDDLSRVEHVLLGPEGQPQPTREHVDPRVTRVGDERRLARPEHMFEGLHPTGVLREWHSYPASDQSPGFEVHTRVAGLGSRDEAIE